MKGMNRMFDVLESLLATADKRDFGFTDNLLVNQRGDTNTGGLRSGLQPSGDIDSLSKNFISILKDVTEMQAYADFNGIFIVLLVVE